MNDRTEKTTHFGYREVPAPEKAGLVREVFDSVAGSYDLMNDLMSMGVHRMWKREFVANSGVSQGDHVLDLAGGTGDIAVLLSKRVGASGRVCTERHQRGHARRWQTATGRPGHCRQRQLFDRQCGKAAI